MSTSFHLQDHHPSPSHPFHPPFSSLLSSDLFSTQQSERSFKHKAHRVTFALTTIQQLPNTFSGLKGPVLWALIYLSDFISCYPVFQPSDLRIPTTNKLLLQGLQACSSLCLECSLLLSWPADPSTLNVTLLAFLITLYKVETMLIIFYHIICLILCTALIKIFNDLLGYVLLCPNSQKNMSSMKAVTHITSLSGLFFVSSMYCSSQHKALKSFRK